jgi:hypothetical protein
MILHFNHVSRGKAAKSLSELTRLVAGSLTTLAEDGAVDAPLLRALRVHLDWIHYKANFRDPVVVRRTTTANGGPGSLAEIAVDLRQANPEALHQQLARALQAVRVGTAENNLCLDEFAPWRHSIIWKFNWLFWQWLSDWEGASGRGFEAALPGGGGSDANHPQAVADSVAEFWRLLKDLDVRGGLPAQIVALEIGVGTGARASAWLDHFKALDEQSGTGYYPRLRFLLGDYSSAILERALKAVGAHAANVRSVPMDALNPFKSLSAYRFKILYVHATNVYDNLPFDELVRRDGRLYLVETRGYLNGEIANKLASDFGITCAELPGVVQRMFETGPTAAAAGERGVAFWRDLWSAFRLEERLRALDDLDEAHVPPGLTRLHLDDLLAEAPDDIRFHISRGAAESFANTLPLLHPRGYLQVQDIFVTSMDEYRQGFKGPGKIDGSLVVWVNGALLRAVGARAGYDVHFAPFPYRPGSKTNILYTTQRP